jgi:hypothetical protein
MPQPSPSRWTRSRSSRNPLRAALGLSLALALSLAGCASGPEESAPVAIALGLPLEEVLAALRADGAPGTRVRLEETRLLRVDVAPYEVLDEEQARDPGFAVALMAGRTCGFREGLSSSEWERGSWFLFRGGRLIAVDHDRFGERCAITLLYEPAPKDEAATGRALTRWITQRYPGDLDDLDGRADRAEAWIRVGRYEEARAVIQALDNRIAVLQDRLRRAEKFEDDELAEFQEEHDRLRSRRAILVQGLRNAGILVG